VLLLLITTPNTHAALYFLTSTFTCLFKLTTPSLLHVLFFYAAHKLRPPTCPPRGFQVPIFLSSLLPFFLSSLLPWSVPKLTASCERPELWRVCASRRVSGGVCLGAVCTCCVCRKAREFPWNTGGGGNTDMFTWGSSRSPCLIYELYASPRGRKLASFF